MIADIESPLKTNNLGNGLVHNPDHVNGAANADHGRGGFHLKSPLFEFHQILCKDLEFSHHNLEFRVSLLLFGIEFKLVQTNIRLFTHGHITAVFKYQPQS